jgi:predicted permease
MPLRPARLAEGFWRSTFGADPNIIGRAIALDREPYTVVGVLPASPAWGAWAKLYTPIDKGLMAQPGERRYRLVARLAPGVDVEQANRELEGLSVSLAAAYPKDNEGVRIFAEDLRADLLDDRDDAILVLYGVVSLLLLLACANVATLLVMRSASRSGEFAIRASLGGRRIQIVRQVLVEHAVVTLAGGGFGFLLGLWARDLLETTINRWPGPFRFDFDAPGAALLALLVLTCAFSFGAVSAWWATRQVFEAPLAAAREAQTGPARPRLRAGLAVFEVAIAVVVLLGTGLMLKGAVSVAMQHPGFDSHDVLTMEINLPEARGENPAVVIEFFRSLTERVRSMPQVESVSAGNPPPFIGWSLAYEADGASPLPGDTRRRAMDAVVMPGYFRTLRIPVIEGRDFSDRDRSGSTPVAVVSRAFARATWPDGRAIGRRVRLLGRRDSPWREVVGVVGDTRTATFTAPGGWVYVPHGQQPFTELLLTIRIHGDVATVIRSVQQLVWQDEPALPVHWNHLLDDLIAERYPEPRIYPRVFSVFAALAVVVALVGVYGVVAYASAGRTREFGIRLAIGAPPSKVWQLVARHGVRLAVAGTAIGMVGALGLMRFAATLFFGVSPTDAWVYASCGALAVAAVLAASAGPAFRASRIDPVTVLRCE